jgi:hypothetical protein
MVPQGSARIVNLGVVDFDSLSVAELQNLLYGTTPIRGNNDASNQLVQGDVFAVLTHGGNYAKVQVSNYDYNLTIRWVTASAASPTDQFTYLPSATVASVKPNQGSAAGATQVAVAGSGFTGATAVQFGGLPAASFVVASDTAIQAVSPAGQGTVDITVTSPGGTSAVSPADKFTYVPPPVVTGVNPNFLNPGQSTTISGSGFSGASAVNFGTVPAASFAVVSDSQINAVIPQGSGSVNVTVTTSAGTSAISTADVFTYVILE